MAKKDTKSTEIKKLAVVVSPFEAAILGKLRKFDFGELLIKKKEGQPYQVITSASTIVRYEEGLELPDSYALTEEMMGGKVDLNKLFTKFDEKIKGEKDKEGGED